MKKAVLLVCFLSYVCSFVPADSSQDPEPYKPEEFPSWARSLRRGEIVALGLFPFVFLFTSLAYQGLRQVSGSDSGLLSDLSSDRQKIGMLTISLSLSTLLAVVDYFLEKGKHKP